MRPISALALTASLFFASPVLAQGRAHDAAAKHKPTAWKEMDAFHALLGATFHPAQGKKDLKPLRAKADSLSAAARSWAASTPPKACAATDIRTTVGELSTDALAIGNQVLQQATDADLMKSITALHTKFEVVEKKCGGHDMKGMKH